MADRYLLMLLQEFGALLLKHVTSGSIYANSDSLLDAKLEILDCYFQENSSTAGGGNTRQ